jgi:HPt (histidine-containing phosphotransfer) domain-containing protein
MTMDLSLLSNLMDGNQQLVDRFVSIFKNQAPPQVAALEKLYENAQWEELSSTLHGLKTQFSYLGLRDLAEQTRLMEELTDEGDTMPVASQIQHFKVAFEQFWANAFPAS